MILTTMNPNPQSAVLLSLLPDDSRVYHFSTNAEPADHLRFVRDVAAYTGHAIIEENDGRDIFAVFCDEQAFFTHGTDEPLCSIRLKRDRFLARVREAAPCTVALPFTSQEYRLAQRMTAIVSMIPGVMVRFPLIEQHLSPTECAHLVFGMWGIAKPAMWQWVGEAVCLPCVRGTAAYFGELWQRNPDALRPLMQAERLTGATVLDEGTLEETRQACLQAAIHRKPTEPLLWTPCLCK